MALLNYLYAVDPEKRRRSDFIRGVKYVVFFIIFFGVIFNDGFYSLTANFKRVFFFLKKNQCLGF